MTTNGSIEAAKIIMQGGKLISTDYGNKTREGLADLIDRKTGASELVARIERIIIDLIDGEYDDGTHPVVTRAIEQLQELTQ